VASGAAGDRIFDDRSVLAGQSQVGGIVVIGDAGVGKTTLARLVTGR